MARSLASRGLLVAALLAGCYKPALEDGFACPGGAKEDCPEDFACCDDGICRRDCSGGSGGGDCEAACPEDDPLVCSVDGVEFPTCVASCRGIGVQCEGSCPCGKCACAEIYDPVCGEDGRTYDNDCQASCAGVGVGCGGECPCADDCACVDEDAPVCGEDGQPYASACEAQCAGLASWCNADCGPGCDCPYECDAVCGADGVTYASQCRARCAGTVALCPGSCPCTCGGCDGYTSPVCTPAGPYGSACDAGCAGQAEVCLGSCPCSVSLPFGCEPVCGTNGVTYTHPNEAKCGGVGVACDGPCPCPGGENCLNGSDDDGDGQTDCADPDCAGMCAGPPCDQAMCNDCVFSACPGPVEDCLNTTCGDGSNCIGIGQCFEECGSDGACSAKCFASSCPEAGEAWEALMVCAGGECAAACAPCPP